MFSPKGIAPVQTPWSGIQEAQYGQKVGHRVKTAILLTPLAPRPSQWTSDGR